MEHRHRPVEKIKSKLNENRERESSSQLKID